MAIGPTGTVSEESTVFIVAAKNTKTKKKNTKQQKIVSFGLLLNKETVNNAIMKGSALGPVHIEVCS